MEFVAIALFVVGVLIPAAARLLDSVAYRNRAKGKAEIIRARRAAWQAPENTSGERRKRRG